MIIYIIIPKASILWHYNIPKQRNSITNSYSIFIKKWLGYLLETNNTYSSILKRTNSSYVSILDIRTWTEANPPPPAAIFTLTQYPHFWHLVLATASEMREVTSIAERRNYWMRKGEICIVWCSTVQIGSGFKRAVRLRIAEWYKVEALLSTPQDIYLLKIS